MTADDRWQEVELPSSKTATIAKYFTRGMEKAIQEARWKGANLEVNPETGEVEVKNLSPNQKQLEEDATVLHGTKSVEDDKMSKKLLDKLSVQDFNFLLKELTDIRAGKKKKKSKK